MNEIARLGSLFRDLQTALLIWLVDAGKSGGQSKGEALPGAAVEVMEFGDLLQEAQSKSIGFSSAFNTRRFGVAVLDSELRVVSANRTFCDLVGIDQEGVQGIPFQRLTTEAEHEALLTETRSARIRSLPSGPRTMELRGPDGVSLPLPAEVRSLSERTVRALSKQEGQRLTTVVVYDAVPEPTGRAREA